MGQGSASRCSNVHFDLAAQYHMQYKINSLEHAWVFCGLGTSNVQVYNLSKPYSFDGCEEQEACQAGCICMAGPKTRWQSLQANR